MRLNEGLPGPLQDEVESRTGPGPVMGAPGDPGRAPGYGPGSPDIRLVAELIRDVRKIRVPVDAGPLEYADLLWKPYVKDAGDARKLAGTALACTDWAPGNIVISGGRAWIARWTRPVLAAPWVDPACLVLELIAHGHVPRDAEALTARESVAFAVADPACLDMFAWAGKEMHQGQAGARHRALEAAARQWHGYRRSLCRQVPGPAGQSRR